MQSEHLDIRAAITQTRNENAKIYMECSENGGEVCMQQ